MKIVIVGGVAGGASAAARARRLCEDCEIVLIERGAEPSFANCGLPYYVGGQIESRDKLLVAPVQRLRKRYRLDVRTRCEVTNIDRDNKTVTVLSHETGEKYTESYDKLILATGAAPFRPPIPGIDGERIFELRDLNDADQLHGVVTSDNRRAVIVGAGFIGIEVAENLAHRGLHVTIVELADQILPPWDREMVQPIELHLEQQGVVLLLGDSAERFEEEGLELVVQLKSGAALTADFAVVSIGVRPENKLALEAGLACGARGGIITNPHMQTNDPDIYAVGDVAEPIVHVDQLAAAESSSRPYVLDVRSEPEFAAGHVPEAVNIPIDDLRERLIELPRDRQIATYCQVGQRGYMATRLLMQKGFDVVNLSGGYTTWKQCGG